MAKAKTVPDRPDGIEWFLKEILAPLGPLLVATGVRCLHVGRFLEVQEFLDEFLIAPEFPFFIIVLGASNIALTYELRPFVSERFKAAPKLLLVGLYFILGITVFGLFPFYWDATAVEQARVEYERFTETIVQQKERAPFFVEGVNPEGVEVHQFPTTIRGRPQGVTVVTFKEPHPMPRRVRVAVMVFNILASVAVVIVALGIRRWHGKALEVARKLQPQE